MQSRKTKDDILRILYFRLPVFCPATNVLLNVQPKSLPDINHCNYFLCFIIDYIIITKAVGCVQTFYENYCSLIMCNINFIQK